MKIKFYNINKTYYWPMFLIGFGLIVSSIILYIRETGKSDSSEMNCLFQAIAGGFLLGSASAIWIYNKWLRDNPITGNEQTNLDLIKFLDTGEMTEYLAGVLKEADKFKALFR